MHKIYLLPNTEPILFLPHFHLFLPYVFPHILSVSLLSLNPYNSLGELSFLGAPKQLSYNHHIPTRSLDSIPFHPSSSPRSWPTGSVNFNISSLILLLFPSYQPHHQSWSSCLLPKPAKVHKTLSPSKSCKGTLKSTQDWISSPHTGIQAQKKAIIQIQQLQRVPFPMENVFEGTKPQNIAFSRTIKVSIQWPLAWFAMARGICLTPKGLHHYWCQTPNTKEE